MMNHGYDRGALVESLGRSLTDLANVTSYLVTMRKAVRNLDDPMHDFHTDHAAANLERTAGVLDTIAAELRALEHQTIFPPTLDGQQQRMPGEPEPAPKEETDAHDPAGA